MFLLLMLSSCSPQEKVITGNLPGTWELVAVYADPGDGSGTYQPVDSDNLLVLRPDGTLSANFNFCVGDAETSSGTYSLQDSTLRPDCPDLRRLPFVLVGDTLTVTNPACIEGCGERYAKVSDEPTSL
ncbi:hypothetical protein CGL56_03565 [Neolewinella marina]|uniref:Lipocalin-like domain-containing protein n=1 Tax=Neolewinella marina TaxID=438751 RepID=A0A2G0CJI6_9BACT|nr:hypothetical protein CGL56_03565 [Neolewinella marina]